MSQWTYQFAQLCLSVITTLLMVSLWGLWFLKRRVEKAHQLLLEREGQLSQLKESLHAEMTVRAVTQEKIKQIELFDGQRLAELHKAHANLSETFSLLSAQQLRQNSDTFFQTAKSAFEQWHQAVEVGTGEKHKAIEALVSPLKEVLEKMEGQVQAMEVSREGAYQGVLERMQHVFQSSQAVLREAEKLSRTLHNPSTRGVWGELQLKRVIEIAGMLPYCDFEEQRSLSMENKMVRPDLIVRLPGGRSIAVDAKVPLQGFLASMDTADEEKRAKLLGDHAEQLKRHITELAKKSYWRYLQQTPEFVILFLPGEVFLGMALQEIPGLIELASEQGVILATPLSLIAMLKAISFGWQQESMAENARKISMLARKFNEQAEKLTESFEKIGRGLRTTVDAYNQTVHVFESRVLSTAKGLQELGVGSGNSKIEALELIDKAPKVGLPEE